MEAQTGSDPKPNPTESPNPDPEPYEEIEEDEEDEEIEEDEEVETLTPEARMRKDRANMNSLFRRLSTEQVPVRVHDVIIKGNRKTKDSLIEAEVEALFRDATSFQQLLRAASVANARLQGLEIFESVNITLDAGPLELPGTANIIIEVSEPNNPLSGSIGAFSKPEARSWTLEGFMKLKNMCGYGDIWDGSLSYGWGQALEVSTGVSVPRFKGIPTPLSARISLLSQDWLKFSSYKEQALGLSLGLLTTGNHNLSYNLSWRTLTDPSQMSSHTVRRQLGHSLLSALKYAFKVDRRDSPMRPTRGHAFLSTTQIGGLFPDIRSLRFIRQEFDLRYAIPLGFYRAALNLGLSGGVVFPWGNGSLSMPSYLPERFFMGGTSSPVCSLSGPTSVLGFKARGLGPAEPRRVVRDDSSDGNSDHPGVDHVGGDLALTAFADLSFDLPLKVLRDAGIHGHVFASTGSLNKLTENAYKGFSLQKFRESFRSSVGFGVIIPTNLFRMEVNYCHILKQQGHDQGKSGVQFTFSSPQ
ncbi:sorting and assembly machinery component 50 homolog [Phtheirospermum japonicum]|uniref:Sorting and assembly machinery component 50 homolog n=1 Tax=Phtheirospermum japonicum TaxID=374723 RepID=A0A830CCC6_9LAMI|nr:sorting and assembly machinery component 50 homolog [Phtheirospermum japonicum]